jgi:hypothetical protein
MRALLGILLIVSGVAVAAVGLQGTATKSTEGEPEPTVVLATAGSSSRPFPVTTVVTLPVKAAAAPEPVAPAAATAPAPTDGAPLVGELQRELTRVGCYTGAVNGMWTLPTRKAMAAFTERVNAKLPVDRADPILLALVQHHAGLACGSCPTSEEVYGDGRCLPKAIMARATIKDAAPMPAELPSSPPAVEKPIVADAGADRPRKTGRRGHRGPPLEGRMGVGIGAVAVGAAQPAVADAKLAAAEPLPVSPQTAQPQRERRAGRHGHRHVASLRSRGYLRPMRPVRYAFRPFGRPRGLAALLFGGL